MSSISLSGRVIGISGKMTLRVSVERVISHPLYRKIVRKSRVYLVDDPQEMASVGDQISIVLVPPVSASKRWRIAKIQRRAS